MDSRATSTAAPASACTEPSLVDRPQEAALLQPLREQAEALAIPVETLTRSPRFGRGTRTDAPRERLCGAPHNRSYVSGDVMWRRRPKAMRGRPRPVSPAT